LQGLSLSFSSCPAHAGHPVIAADEIEPNRRGILDHPLELVIGLAVGEIWWRMMTAATGDTMDKTAPHPLFKLATELGPLIIFFVANAKFNLFVATGAFMVAIVAAMIASYVVTRHVPIMALVTGVVVIVFGTLTLVLHDETFIKVKPTIIYGLFAAVLGGGLLFGRSFIAIMFDQMFNLTAEGWRLLTIRWAMFFFGMAILNEIIWRTQTTDFWVAFKAFGVIPLTMAFAIAQMPLTKRYHLEPASLEASEADAGDVTK
jgi:intracellular septation protein